MATGRRAPNGAAADGDEPRPAPFRRIKAHLLERIHAGEWRAGDTIPGEEALAREYGCARATVHRALRELAEAGLLERRRRKGTRIALPPARVATFEVARVDEEIRALGANYGYSLLERRLATASAEARERLRLASRATALRVTALHLANEAPYQLEQRWINVAAVPAVRDADLCVLAPGSWLLQNVPWTEVEHTLSATEAGAREAGWLAVPPGSALFVVERRTWLESTVVTWVRFLHPGRHFRMRSRAHR